MAASAASSCTASGTFSTAWLYERAARASAASAVHTRTGTDPSAAPSGGPFCASFRTASSSRIRASSIRSGSKC